MSNPSAVTQSREDPPDGVSNIDPRPDEQLALARTFAGLYPEMPFGERPRQDARYWLANRWFAAGDGVVLYAMLRHLQPRRFLQVGAGFSSACALDTAARFVPGMVMRFFEPQPERLNRLLRPTDRARVLVRPHTDYQLADFADIQSGDVLFIDSGALNAAVVDGLLFGVAPQLPTGSYVHVQDRPARIGLRRRQPPGGTDDTDLIRRLSDVAGLQVVWRNRELGRVAHSEIGASMPAWAADPGTSLWLRRG